MQRIDCLFQIARTGLMMWTEEFALDEVCRHGIHHQKRKRGGIDVGTHLTISFEMLDYPRCSILQPGQHFAVDNFSFSTREQGLNVEEADQFSICI